MRKGNCGICGEASSALEVVEEAEEEECLRLLVGDLHRQREVWEVLILWL